MEIRRVAVIFDNTVRPETTGVYCRRALGELVKVEHFLPADLPTIPRRGFDLYVNIDDGLRYRLPQDLRPCAWWAIDTHLAFDWYREKGPDFDFVFAAQRDGAEKLSQAGILARWLPLACDPRLHCKQDTEKCLDVSFVGNLFPGPRTELVELLLQFFPLMFVGQAYGEDITRLYSQSRIVFNRSIVNDVNMRVFEALACGSLLVTDDLNDNGLGELFESGKHLVVYHDAEALLERIRWYLGHDDERENIAAAGRQAALERHTYRHRMESLLQQVADSPPAIAVGGSLSEKQLPSSLSPDTPRPMEYFRFSRPELQALVPHTAQRILDVGCGAGALGATLKARQGAFVWGIELDPTAAAFAEQQLDGVSLGDAEEWSPDVRCQAFDCILCGDILEHLRYPQVFLRRSTEWLSPDGVLVASIPNVRHHSIIRHLLEGNWTYESAGLLDRSHLQFFTRHGVHRLLQEAGYTIVSVGSVHCAGYAEWSRKGRPAQVDLGALRLTGTDSADAEDFFIYQYLVTASPLATT